MVMINYVNFLILGVGLTSYYFEYYVLTFYSIVHFLVLIAQYLSHDFAQTLNNFKTDQITIKNHYLKDFKFFYYFVFIVRIITFLFYFFFFSTTVDVMNSLSNLFYIITYIFIIVGFLDLGITLFIIFFKNNPILEVVLNVCYHCTTKAAPMVGALHVSSNVPFIAPNPVSNWYHLNTPLGRGYGAWSSGQLLQVDYIKTQMGSDFDYKEIVDNNRMLDPKKIKSYSELNNINFKNLQDIAQNKPKNT